MNVWLGPAATESAASEVLQSAECFVAGQTLCKKEDSPATQLARGLVREREQSRRRLAVWCRHCTVHCNAALVPCTLCLSVLSYVLAALFSLTVWVLALSARLSIVPRCIVVLSV